MDRLIVTNGDCAAARLRQAGVASGILLWRDVLHDGPVRQGLGLAALSEERARFVSEAFGVDPGEAATAFRARDAALAAGHQEGIVVLLEHDLYDQLQLLQILDALAGNRLLGRARIAQADDHLGTAEPETLTALLAAAAPVTGAQAELARRAWAAFRAPEPTGLAALLDEDLSALSYLRPSLLRLLAEYPSSGTGLSLTEERALEALAAGPLPAGRLFERVAAREEARFMGDASFFMRLDGLAFVREPLLEGLAAPFRPPPSPDAAREAYAARARTIVRLSPFGRAVLAGEADHAAANAIERWIGGVRLAPGHLWRWDRAALALVPPGVR